MAVDFATFYHQWGDIVGWDVPDAHLLACDWLQHGRKGRVGVLKAFRGFSKSTIMGRYVPWRLKRSPTWRFLEMSATDADAAKMSADSRFVIRQHPWCAGMEGKDLWAVHQFSIQGHDDPRNPNVATYGVLSNITGSRADEVILDDVEVPKTIRTPALRQSLRQRIAETTHILVPGGKKLYIGTDHCVDSIYKEQIEKGADLLEIPLFRHEVTHQARVKEKDYLFAFRVGKESDVLVAVGSIKPRLLDPADYEVHGVRSYKGGFIRLKKPPRGDERITILAGNMWPGRFSRAEVAFRMSECHTWGEWDSQYQLRPAQMAQVRLNPDRLVPYRGEPEIRRVNGEVTMWLNGVRIVGASTYWDCSLGKVKSDSSSVAVTFTDSAGHEYWHRSLRLKGEIDEQCLEMVPVIRELALPSLIIETNGPGGFVPAIMRKHLKMQRVECSVDSRWVRTSKNTRILDALEPPLSGGFLYASEQVMASPAIAQMREWDPKVADQPDDDLDALAGAISETPVRIGASLPPVEATEDRWSPGGGVYTAKTDF